MHSYLVIGNLSGYAWDYLHTLEARELHVMIQGQISEVKAEHTHRLAIVNSTRGYRTA